MGHIVLEEIEIRNCYQGRVRRFNDWRLSIGAMTGVPVRYVIVEKNVSLKSEGPMPAPTRLPFVEVAVDGTTLTRDLTPQQRVGFDHYVTDMAARGACRPPVAMMTFARRSTSSAANAGSRSS